MNGSDTVASYATRGLSRLYIAKSDLTLAESRATSRAFLIDGTPLGPHRLAERLVIY